MCVIVVLGAKGDTFIWGKTMENKYTLSVLFVNYEDFWSKVVYYILGRGYGHASIGVDQNDEVYWSFNFKGFRREKPRKHEDIVSKSICYKLSVSKEEYHQQNGMAGSKMMLLEPRAYSEVILSIAQAAKRILNSSNVISILASSRASSISSNVSSSMS